MEELSIKSKHRVATYGEVYTPENIVNDMLDLVKEESYRLDATFLEPACGNGNFLVQILKRKLLAASNDCSGDYDTAVFKAVSTIYGIDILKDNIAESKSRMLQIIKESYVNKTGRKISYALLDILSDVINANIIQGNSLTSKTASGDDMLIAEWSINNGIIKRVDYYFCTLSTPMPMTAGEPSEIYLLTDDGPTYVTEAAAEVEAEDTTIEVASAVVKKATTKKKSKSKVIAPLMAYKTA